MAQYAAGDLVEVSLKQDGYFGSYFEAKVLSRLHGSFYKVEYKNLVTEGPNPRPLVETISVNDIRPLPPNLSHPTTFNLNEKVDVFDMDAWWYGEFRGQVDDMCYVYFPTTKQLCEYPPESIRRHLELINGQWIPSAMPIRRR